MSIVDYSVLKNEDHGAEPPFKSDESGLHGEADFPIAVYNADVTNNFVSWHWHEELEFGFVTEGSVLIECGKNKHILNTGDIYFVNANTLHALFRSGSGTKSVFRSVVVHGSIVGGRDNSVYHRKYVAPITGSSGLRELILTPKDSGYSKILGLLTNIWNTESTKMPDHELYVRSELSELFRILISISEKNVSARPAASIVQEARLREILLFIHDHYGEKITLEDMAAAAFVSKSEVLRCFKNITGQSPFEYLKNYRLRNAAYMIKNTSDSINTICGLCGFDDHSYFSKAFKEAYGCSPREFRK